VLARSFGAASVGWFWWTCQPSCFLSGPYDFHTDQWAALYTKRIDAMIAALKSKGVPVIWVGLPAIRGTKATGDMSYLDELYRERAERAGIIYVDIWDGFVDEDGDYAMQGPDFEGQTRRLRTADGVYFTKAGAVKIASYVDRELRRVMPSYVAPVALPGPGTDAEIRHGRCEARCWSSTAINFKRRRPRQRTPRGERPLNADDVRLDRGESFEPR
jgi:hypothetical protein